jgi:hypothetical protein
MKKGDFTLATLRCAQRKKNYKWSLTSKISKRFAK